MISNGLFYLLTNVFLYEIQSAWDFEINGTKLPELTTDDVCILQGCYTQAV